MNWNNTKTYWQAFSLLLLLGATACGSSSESQGTGNPTAADNAAPVEPGKNYFALHLPSGTHEMLLEGGQVFLDGPDYALTGKNKGEKRKYYNAAGEVVLEVKYSDTDKFKLRNADGSLRWKIKLYEDKIKVADNEEMENPYEIRWYDDNRLKIKRNNEELAEWNLPPAAASELTREGIRLEGIAPGLTAGVALLEALTEQEQMVLMAELFTR